MILRRFLYLDADLTAEFLAQAEGGVAGDEEQTTRAKKGRGLGGGVGAGPVTGKAEASSGQEQETSRTVAQTPESNFDRLAGLLEANDGIQFLEGLDEGIWAQLKRGEILEVEADVGISTFIRLMDVASGLGPLLDTVQQLGGEELDPEGAQALQGMASIAKLTSKTPVTASVRGTPEYKFFTPLEAKSLRVELAELEGEATLVAKVHRKLREGDSVSALDAFPGLGSLPASQRAEMEDAMSENDTLADSVVGPPAAVVTPIAIYR